MCTSAKEYKRDAKGVGVCIIPCVHISILVVLAFALLREYTAKLAPTQGHTATVGARVDVLLKAPCIRRRRRAFAQLLGRACPRRIYEIQE